MLYPLTTQIVGSYTKPPWLFRYDNARRFDDSAWRVEPDARREALDDAVSVAVFDQERAGLDLLTDGEVRRIYYDRYIYTKLSGVDSINLARRELPQELNPPWRGTKSHTLVEREKAQTELPQVVGPIGWNGPITVADLRYARTITSKPLKASIIGPLTIWSRVFDSYYRDDKRLIHALASALNKELRALEEAGATAVHIDEPIFHFFPERAERIGVGAIEELVDGLSVPVILGTNYGSSYGSTEKLAHDGYGQVLRTMSRIVGVDAICMEYEEPGYGGELLLSCGDKHVIVGLLNLGSEEIETAEHVAGRIREASQFVPLERFHPSTDGGLWHVPRNIAFAKIQALVAGTNMVRRERGLASR